MTLEELIEKRREINEEFSRIESEERIKKNSSLVGKYFKYRNSYSCPKKPTDYWWLYVAIVGIDECGHMITVEFQIDKDGTPLIAESTKFSTGLSDSYKQIRRLEFDGAKEAFLLNVTSILDKTEPKVKNEQ